MFSPTKTLISPALTFCRRRVAKELARRCFSLTSSSSSPEGAAAAITDRIVPRQTVQMSRLMTQEHANIRGFIHGGYLIKLMEEAGFVAATRQSAFANEETKGRTLGALARIEQLDFLMPVEVGDVVEIEGGVDFASAHSCRVSLELSAAHLVQPDRVDRGLKLTNKAKLWYVSEYLDESGEISVGVMPKVDLSDIVEDQLLKAEKDYLELKASRKSRAERERQSKLFLNNLTGPNPDVDSLLSKRRIVGAKPGTVAWTKSTHSCLVDHNYCDIMNNLSGGAFMKMADEVAALAASKHTMGGTPTTAAVDAVDFRKTVPIGSFVSLESEVTYAGGKSCSVFVRCDAVHILNEEGPVAIPRAMEARFTFVAFGSDGQLMTMPPLTPETDDEKLFYQRERERYRQRKRVRNSN